MARKLECIYIYRSVSNFRLKPLGVRRLGAALFVGQMAKQESMQQGFPLAETVNEASDADEASKTKKLAAHGAIGLSTRPHHREPS